MTIANILKPYSFTNNTETADATKVNADFDATIAGVNDCINAINAAASSKVTLVERLDMSLNSDGSIKSTALPIGTYDCRRTRTVTTASSAANKTQLDDDAIILVDTSAGDITFTLLPTGTAIPIKIVNISSAGNSVLVTPDGTDTIMGLTEYEMSGGGESVTLLPGAAIWWRG